jgi:hypothetical protein
MSLDDWGNQYKIPNNVICQLHRHRFSGPHAITWAEDQILHEVLHLPIGAIATICDAIAQWLDSPQDEEGEPMIEDE